MTAPDPALDALRDALGAHYDVQRRLGQGGMGSVFLARDRTLERDVAIKVINDEVASNPSLRERFLAEARAVAKLRHPGIVAVYAAGEAGGQLYFAMEYVPGESLRERLTRTPQLDAGATTRLVREIAEALDHAHAAGLVHRDVKPENILLDAASGRAMLTDFGVARALEQSGDLTGTGMILGSPRYMSPEQASGDALDGRSDLYALALVGYECLSGAPVVDGPSFPAILVKHLTQTPAPLASVVPGVPAALAAAIERGLAKDPSERWQTGAAFAAALAAGPASSAPALQVALHTGADARRVAAEAGGGAPALQLRSAGRVRHLKPWVMAVAGVAMLATGLGLRPWLRAGAPADAPTGSRYLVAPFEIQSGDPSVTWLREGSVNMLTLALGQWSDLHVVDYERTLSFLDAAGVADKPRLSLDDARTVARRAAAALVLTGQVQTTRDSLRVIAKLYDVRSGDVREQAEEAGALADDPRPVFDRLARRLLNVAGGPASTVELRRATTSNLGAYRAYLDGLRLLQSWRLLEADSAFAVAVAADSSFALAYHKRALALGWSQATGPAYVDAAAQAFALADRLPPRERALVEGHHYLVRGLSAGGGVPAAADSAVFDRAIRTYAELIAKDSLVAEAWYGWADANFHGRSGEDLVQLTQRTNDAIRGFHRTLQIDSSFHLAYSHLVQLYNAATDPNQGLLLVADTSVLLTSQQALAAFGGAPAVARATASAAARGLDIARAWARADRGSAQPVVQLAQSFAQAGQVDSAVAVLRGARLDRAEQRVLLSLELTKYLLATSDPTLTAHLRGVLDAVPAPMLEQLSIGVRFQGVGALLEAAAATGSTALLDRVAQQYGGAARALPELAQLVEGSTRVLRAAMGTTGGPELRRALGDLVRHIDGLPPGMAAQARAGSLSHVYLGVLLTGDTALAGTVRRWTGVAAPFPELDAMEALARGDSATARRLAAGFPPADSLRSGRFGIGGMRTLARAGVVARLGAPAEAAAMLEAIDPRRLSSTALAEPGYTLLTRSWLERARLWRAAGDRAKAIAAYEGFLQRWRESDGAARRELDEAMRELAALRDG